jgi:ATP-binding cassette subfamily B protein
MRGKLKHILTHIKPYRGLVVLIIALLFAQAFCELALPSYTSDIVNVGIQQAGIKDLVPDAMRRNTMDKILLLSSGDQAVLLQSVYKADADGTLVLIGVTEQQRAQLEGIFITRLSILSSIANNSEMTSQYIPQLPPGTDLFSALGMMPDQQRMAIIDKIDQMTARMPESILRQTAIAAVRSEYTALGRDLNALQMGFLWSAGLRMIGVVFIAVCAAVMVIYLSSRVAAGFSRGLRESVFKKVISFGSMEFDKFSTASLITRSTNDIQQVQMMLMMVFRVLVYSPILAIGGVVKALGTNMSMAWTIGLGVGSVLTIIGVLIRIAMPRFRRLQDQIDRLNLVTREILSGIPVIRAFCTQKHEVKRFDKANRDLMKTNLFVNRVMALTFPLMFLIMNALTVLILYRGAVAVDLGQMQVGDMMAFMQYAMQIVMSFLMMSMMSIMLPRAGVSIGRINEVLETEPSIDDPATPSLRCDALRGTVQFENVSFRYPNAEADVVSNVSFTAKRGQTTAIIGSTGSGKSTIINLIPRFFDVSSGRILVGGVDIREMTQKELRDCIGYVPQHGILFSGTIESNLRFGRENATQEEIEKAAQIAQAFDFINEKQEGFEAPIAQGGTNVSGGQKQRLSIARAVVKNPDIYIFDDSFSALDYKTDVQLRRALKAYTAQSTVIIVAQRVNTILHADQIVVIEDGRVVGIGTHAQLLSSCPVYEQIASSQLSPEEIERSRQWNKEGENNGR